MDASSLPSQSSLGTLLVHLDISLIHGILWCVLESVSFDLAGLLGYVLVSGWPVREQTVWISTVNSGLVNQLINQLLPWCLELLACQDRPVITGQLQLSLSGTSALEISLLWGQLLPFGDGRLFALLVRRDLSFTLSDEIHVWWVAAECWRQLLPEHGEMAHLGDVDHVRKLQHLQGHRLEGKCPQVLCGTRLWIFGLFGIPLAIFGALALFILVLCGAQLLVRWARGFSVT